MYKKECKSCIWYKQTFYSMSGSLSCMEEHECRHPSNLEKKRLPSTGLFSKSYLQIAQERCEVLNRDGNCDHYFPSLIYMLKKPFLKKEKRNIR
ncbi:MAG: hypothetical protein IE889_03090 [Campylobacterales bacterium]|nr:hypothetical protein [Campylobacterales bacterium]